MNFFLKPLSMRYNRFSRVLLLYKYVLIEDPKRRYIIIPSVGPIFLRFFQLNAHQTLILNRTPNAWKLTNQEAPRLCCVRPRALLTVNARLAMGCHTKTDITGELRFHKLDNFFYQNFSIF